MGCVKSLHLKNKGEIFPKDVSLINEHYSLPISNEDKALLRESWKQLENMKDAMGKTIFTRLLELNPDIQDTFPSFRGVALDELMNSRSLFLHSKRLMVAVEKAVSSLEDGQEIVERLTDLGQRHITISITEKHFKIMEKALVLTLKDLLKTDYTEDIAHAWTELFGFMTVTMLAGKERAHEHHNSLM